MAHVRSTAVVLYAMCIRLLAWCSTMCMCTCALPQYPSEAACRMVTLCCVSPTSHAIVCRWCSLRIPLSVSWVSCRIDPCSSWVWPCGWTWQRSLSTNWLRSALLTRVHAFAWGGAVPSSRTDFKVWSCAFLAGRGGAKGRNTCGVCGCGEQERVDRRSHSRQVCPQGYGTNTTRPLTFGEKFRRYAADLLKLQGDQILREKRGRGWTGDYPDGGTQMYPLGPDRVQVVAGCVWVPEGRIRTTELFIVGKGMHFIVGDPVRLMAQPNRANIIAA